MCVLVRKVPDLYTVLSDGIFFKNITKFDSFSNFFQNFSIVRHNQVEQMLRSKTRNAQKKHSRSETGKYFDQHYKSTWKK